jgi:hypothetical protein
MKATLMTRGDGSRRPWKRFAAALGFAGVVLASGVVPTLPGAQVRAEAGPATTGAAPGFRRLNELQYARSIEQVFGPGIKIPGRFEPPLRDNGLLAIGDNSVSVSASGLEQYQLRAREIAAQVMAEDRRDKVMTCKPKSAAAFDRACAAEILGAHGRLLYRRPLTAAELTSVLGVAAEATRQSASFAKGLQFGFSRLLASPNFLFRVERSMPDPAIGVALRLDDYSLATRISFLLWDAPPDAELLEAAARGDLGDQAKLESQVDRMIASPRFADGVRSFFSDMFGFDQFKGLSKDQAIYPRFTSELLNDAQQQALMTIVDHLVTTKSDYRELFTTKKTFVNRNLGSLYKIPVGLAGMQGWVPHTFAPEDRRGGILTLPAFLMLDPTHQGRSSPTIRGKVVRELMLCERVPDPPPNVDFALVSDIDSELHKTARQRLTIHQENPACAGCHKVTDPIGLALENYDAIGEFRTHENGALIDASGEFEGSEYKDALGLSQLLRDSPAIPDCAVQRAFEYGVGRPIADSEQRWLDYVSQSFVAQGYRFPELMRTVATSAAFRTIARQPATPAKVAAWSPHHPSLERR